MHPQQVHFVHLSAWRGYGGFPNQTSKKKDQINHTDKQFNCQMKEILYRKKFKLHECVLKLGLRLK